MAKDDYFVITYKLLKYLYSCLKSSIRPSMEILDARYFAIEELYWEYIIKHLYNDGYIEGVEFIPVGGASDTIMKIYHDSIGITPKGIQYLEENSIFEKVKAIAKDISAIIPTK